MESANNTTLESLRRKRKHTDTESQENPHENGECEVVDLENDQPKDHKIPKESDTAEITINDLDKNDNKSDKFEEDVVFLALKELTQKSQATEDGDSCEEVVIEKEKESEEIIFVEEVDKGKHQIEVIEILDDTPLEKRIAVNQTIPHEPPVSRDNQNRRHFLHPQEAATDIVDLLLSRGHQRAIRDGWAPVTPTEHNIFLQVKISWLGDLMARRRRDNEDRQDYCWRVRAFTKRAFLQLARQMSHESVLAWAIIENNKEHIAKFQEEQRSRQLRSLTPASTAPKLIVPGKDDPEKQTAAASSENKDTEVKTEETVPKVKEEL
ncbi:uncharacterized protein LOC132193481 [Neocloeon triangulifer]|uniref:uncharacterized protein LOC132193481 n=1 Tax=Neocloeon triangulifer TaxID=2078957 RepID=UPI00286F9F8B|nr:uncharacterized protein LOC132193481 [Neocloeon triangulifer]XP_059470169.1 uncharacterized protein LOC132193481 [Neocloeon triangulifer]